MSTFSLFFLEWVILEKKKKKLLKQLLKSKNADADWNMSNIGTEIVPTMFY